MSETKELTLTEVAAHNTKKDLYMIIHEKVYDVTSFVDEHPYVPPRILLPLPSLPSRVSHVSPCTVTNWPPRREPK